MPPPPLQTPLQTIAVTGASGFVGREIVRELLTRGYHVRGLVRSITDSREAFAPARAAAERAGAATGGTRPTFDLIAGDICDPAALADLLRGAQACIHLVGIIREVRGDKQHPQTFERLHTRATERVLDACRAAGVNRYLHMSTLGVGPEGRSEYQKTKWAAEQAVRRAGGGGGEAGLAWTIFRPSVIHGPQSELIQTIADLASGEVMPYFFIPYFVRSRRDLSVPAGATFFEPANIQPIAVEDVAFAFAEALVRPESIGEVYNLVGSETLNWQELTEFLRDTLPGTSKGLNTWFVPGEHAAAIATVAEKVGLGGLLPFDKGQALMATEESTADATKARVQLGLEPKPFRASVRAYASAV